MADILLSRMMMWVVSTVIGGFGMFCLIMSFSAPILAGHALVLLGAASAIELLTNR